MLRTVFLLCLLFVAAFAPQARAQTPHHIWAQATVGPYWFIDEDPIDHLIVGGNAHVTWTPRLGFEADGLYMFGPARDRDAQFALMAMWDIFRPRPDNPRRYAPYVFLGPAVMWHYEDFGTRGTFTSHEFGVAAGGGVRIAIPKFRRWFAAPEFRVGPDGGFGAALRLGYVVR
jgi:hypothetical protein